jgi:peptide/nickel transport system substrate-binding protein
VRLALGGLFDFEWANKNLFSGSYARIRSFYDGSELSSYGTPASEAEKALLEPYADKVLPEIMAGTWTLPVSDGSGRDRAFLKKGFDALKAAGYRLDNDVMVGPDGKPLAFEILLNGKASESVAAAWQRTLSKLGIAVSIRSVDSAQFLQRQRTYDFDAMIVTYTSSLSPGTEQMFRWGSASRDTEGTFNFAGVAEPAIDALIDRLLTARSREEFVTAVRAYDRLLLSGGYVVPLYYQPQQWVGRWAQYKFPEHTSIYGYFLPAWWQQAQ